MCQEFRRAGIATIASGMHILAKAHGGTNDDLNLEALCWKFHIAKTNGFAGPFLTSSLLRGGDLAGSRYL